MSFPSLGTDPAANVDPDPDESKLHSLLLAAAADVVGPSLAREVFSIARERPRRTPAARPPAPRTPAADFRCHAPVTLFRRLLARATRGGAPSPRETEPLPRRALGEDFGDEIREEDEIRVFADEIVRTSEKQTSAIRVVSVSSYGTVRSRTYASAEALADAIVEAADPSALGALVADVRVEKLSRGEEDEDRRRIGFVDEGFGTTESSNTETCAFVNDDTHDTHETHDARYRERHSTDPKDTRSRETSRETFRNKTRPKKLGGEIRFVTASRMRDARTYNLLLCRSCGAFLQGDKGLREHCQVRHGTSYEASLERVADARNALVVFVRAEPPRAERRGSAEAPMGKNADGTNDPSVFARPVAQKKTRARDGLPLGLRLARDGHLSALRALVADTGWDPTSHTSVDANGSCALHWAAGGGFLETCAYLVDVLREDPRRAQEKDGRAAIHWAARNGRLETCRWLVHTCGVSVDEPTHDGTTPFMWCVWGGGGGEETDPRKRRKRATTTKRRRRRSLKKNPRSATRATSRARSLGWCVTRSATCTPRTRSGATPRSGRRSARPGRSRCARTCETWAWT